MSKKNPLPKTRERIIFYLCSHPNEPHTVKEIAEALKMTTDRVRGAVKRLLKNPKPHKIKNAKMTSGIPALTLFDVIHTP